MTPRLTLLSSLVLLAACTNDPCPATGTGTLVTTSTGLPSGAVSQVDLIGPLALGPGTRSFQAGETLPGISAGQYRVKPRSATLADPLVRTAWSSPEQTVCVRSGASTSVAFSWTLIPTSNTMWWLSSNNGPATLLGYASSLLGMSGTASATAKPETAAGKDLTFDRDGNLWSLGGTVSDPLVVRYPAASVASSGPRTFDRGFTITGVTCASALAFSNQGDLYVSDPCEKTVVKLAASTLEASSGQLVPALTLSGFSAPHGLAFDSSHNLWVADTDAQALYRFDATSLGGTGASWTAKVQVQDGAALTPNWLAFDAAGNLWADDFAANVVFKVAQTDLLVTGAHTATAQVSITLGVTALLEGLAFDEAGGLWFATTQGHFGRLAPAQLTTSSSSGAPTTPATIISSGDVGSASNVALFPAPAGLPLFHRL